MSINLKGRSLLKLSDFSTKEIRHLLDLAKDLKYARLLGTEKPALRGKNIALIFEMPSTRTRGAFEVALSDQGGSVTYIGPQDSHFREKESVKDTARVLGRIYDGIGYRGKDQVVLETLAKYSGIPVWNCLTAEFHPTQVLADLLTMTEHADKPLKKMSLCFLGNACNNVCSSLMEGAARIGIDFRIAAPRPCQPNRELTEKCMAMAKENGGKILISEQMEEAVSGADFIYTDVWVSMGEPDPAWEELIKLLEPYQVNDKVMKATQNHKVRFMHCLPAFHNTETKTGKAIFEKYGIKSLEVTQEVFESAASIVFDQAENRMHTIKSMLVATLA
jgi:ornithine carbamoyltransferase